jgi:hypothetical protein
MRFKAKVLDYFSEMSNAMYHHDSDLKSTIIKMRDLSEKLERISFRLKRIEDLLVNGKPKPKCPVCGQTVNPWCHGDLNND